MRLPAGLEGWWRNRPSAFVPELAEEHWVELEPGSPDPAQVGGCVCVAAGGFAGPASEDRGHGKEGGRAAR